MSLEKPEKIRTLQRKLYCKAKAEPAYRFYQLYDKVCREDILLHAYKLARANAGASGVDGITFAQIEAAGGRKAPITPPPLAGCRWRGRGGYGFAPTIRCAQIMNQTTEAVIERPTARPAMGASLLLKQFAK